MNSNNIVIFSEGVKEQPSLIFIHGFPLTHYMWKYQVEEFKNNYYVTTYDVRGLGSSPAGDGQFTIDMFVDDLLEIMEKENLEKRVICGLSMGGYIALRALERGERLFAGAILCDTKAEADSNEIKIKRGEGVKLINREGIGAFVDAMVPSLFAEKNRGGKEYRATIERGYAQNPLGVKGCLIAMAGRTDTTEYLSRIKIPVLLLVGEEDGLTPPGLMKEISFKIRGSDFYVVPGAGHMSPLENPDFVNERINEFLRRCYR
jgi:3-oxoadipate enol-lactonase